MRGTVPLKGTVPAQCISGLYNREVELFDSPLVAQLDESHRSILSVDFYRHRHLCISAGSFSYFSCLPVGLNGQAGPVLVEPHQMHLLAPCPWRCLPVGENGHADPYDDEPYHSQCFSSSTCSCARYSVKLWTGRMGNPLLRLSSSSI